MSELIAKNVGLFCGARKGSRPEFIQVAQEFGTWVGRSGRRLIYGGGSVCLMGVAADAALAAGGEVLGIITEKLVGMEVGHRGITKMLITPTMAERKMQLIAESDVFVILPGGLGTFDELFEVLTLRQLGYHQKMTYIVNTAGYFDPLLTMLEHTAGEGFMARDNLVFFQAIPDVHGLSQVLL
ncbi:MAG: TIGR00730 family Rossman fold protein [Bdellovibrionales bacterium]|nr:TIGR00730 family Rossman fold protein [Bdellovibrionales bacterium]